MPATKLFPRLTSLAGAVVLIAALAAITLRAYHFWQELNNQQQAAGQNITQPGVGAPQRPHSDIVKFHLFGQPATVITEPPEEPENLPETRLKLILRGVSSLAVNSPDKPVNYAELNTASTGGALIEGPDRVTEFFPVGSNLPGNARLHAVHANRIVIDRKGKLENLSFPDDWANPGGIANFNAVQNVSEDYADDAMIDADLIPEDSGFEQNSTIVDDTGVSQDQLAIQARLFEERVMMGQAESFDDGATIEESDDASETAGEDRREEIKSRLQNLRDLIRQQRNQ